MSNNTSSKIHLIDHFDVKNNLKSLYCLLFHFLYQEKYAAALKKNSAQNASNRLKQKTLKKTRKFMIDGVVVTTTTSKVIYGDEDKQLKDDHVLRYIFIHFYQIK